MTPELARRTHWLEAHPDWIPCRLPHFSIREAGFYFLACERPRLAATPSLIELIGTIDGDREVASLMKDEQDGAALAELWAAGVVTLVPAAGAEAGPKIVAIEPHPDDVALSAGGALLLRRESARKTILSVMSRSNGTFYMATPERRYFDVALISELRQQESLLAARYLKARYQTLCEPDIAIRYIDPERYVTGDLRATMRAHGAYRHAPPPPEEIGRLAARLWQALEEASPDQIWMPLGLGNHFDHRLIRDACLHVVSKHWGVLQSVQILFYEDLPYAFDHPGSVDAVVAMLRQRGAELERRPVAIDAVLADKIECLKIYASQLPIEQIQPVIEGYASSAAGAAGGHAEVLWQLTRPPALPFAPIVVAEGVPAAALADAARRVFERRATTRRLGLLIGHQLCEWVELARLLRAIFPNARLDVLASGENREALAGPDDPRIRVAFFERSAASRLLAIARWAGRFDDTVLVFGGPQFARAGGWLARLLPSRHAYAFENLSDMCGLWRYWLEDEGARRGPGV